MRGLRSTIALLIVLIGLGAYIYFVTWRQDDAGSDGELVFASLEAADIQELKVKSVSGDVTTVRKESDVWQVVDPITARAADPEVSGITSALDQLEITRVIDENPADLTEYGLAEPRIQIDFTSSASGAPSGRLLVGATTPTGGGLYAKRDDEARVFLIPAYQETSLNRSTFDLRDKSLMTIERDKIDRVLVRLRGETIQFAKQDGEWRMTAPIETRADLGSVEALVGRVDTAQMQSVAAEEATPADLKQFGLADPDVVVTVVMGSARAELALGGKTENGVYARDLSRRLVATVDNSLAEDLSKRAEDYRRRDAFEMRAYNATRVEFTRSSGEPIVLERVKGPGTDAANEQEVWRRVSPNPADLDRSQVDSLLAGLADIRATSFSASRANTGLDSPVLTVVAVFDEGKEEERVVFGRRGDAAYFSRPDESGAAAIEAEKLAEAIKALDELSK